MVHSMLQGAKKVPTIAALYLQDHLGNLNWMSVHRGCNMYPLEFCRQAKG